jgi:intracellular septation protein
MKHKPLIRFVLDMGPLMLFFAANKFFGIYGATAIFMVAVTVALGLGYWLEKKISPMPAVTAILVLVLGGMTLFLKNDTFIKIKPTILYAAFAAILIGGLFFERLLIKFAFSEAFNLTEKGWRMLTWRWAGFFVSLALLNEFVWRNFSTDRWVDFKVWVIVPLFFLFALAQTPLIMAHEKKDSPPET